MKAGSFTKHTLRRATDFLADNLALLTFRLVILCLVMFDLGPSIMSRERRRTAGEATTTVAHRLGARTFPEQVSVQNCGHCQGFCRAMKAHT